MAGSGFYSEVPIFTRFPDLLDGSYYRPLPEDWVVGMTDVVSSRQAIAEGRYKAVNVAGVAVIAGLSNALGQEEFPFVFGGDGASFAIPPEAAEAARGVLAASAGWAREELGLTLRAALMPVATIREAGSDVRVARFAPSPNVCYAMFAGGGLAWASAAMKAGRFAVPPTAGASPDLNGLSCRWQPIPARRGVILSLIVVPAGAVVSEDYRRLVHDILELATHAERPVPSVAAGWSPAGAEIEAHVMRRSSGPLALRRLLARAKGFFSFAFLKTIPRIGQFDTAAYIKQTIENSDFRKYDDGLRMTVDCTAEEADRIEARLAEADAAGISLSGAHRQDAALMTCFVPSALRSDHVHFIDGAGGGYAAAAIAMQRNGHSRQGETEPTPA
ncbi:DUF3095 domain-containing protein [Chelatococcus sp. GCM10030263]|uniref:DUF3095 domain-containing protein n=1 Tax=Chelatococcus sp. GCM10030263 TaxID=3273387 RepID=UPI003614C185